MSYPLMQGTRSRATARCGHPPDTMCTKSLSTDQGLSKLAAASMTFVAGSAQVQAANGTFAAFAVQDSVIVLGTNSNNGDFTVTGIDSTNQSYLVLDPPPKSEGPVTATVRTP